MQKGEDSAGRRYLNMVLFRMGVLDVDICNNIGLDPDGVRWTFPVQVDVEIREAGLRMPELTVEAAPVQQDDYGGP